MSAGRDKKAHTKERKRQIQRSLKKRDSVKLGQKVRHQAKRVKRYITRLNDPRRKKVVAPPSFAASGVAQESQK